jgi:hypothetical protein
MEPLMIERAAQRINTRDAPTTRSISLGSMAGEVRFERTKTAKIPMTKYIMYFSIFVITSDTFSIAAIQYSL